MREIANAYTALDQLHQAESLLRRSLVLQDSSITRRMLADLLSAQNFAESALREYQVTLQSTKDSKERVELLEKCHKLLTTLGRNEESSEYRQMIQSIHPDTE